LVLALSSGPLTVQTARGQTAAADYPQRTVTFLCPFPAGGGTDILTRMLAQELQEKLARTIIVDNRPGAGTIVAAPPAPRARAASQPPHTPQRLPPPLPLAPGAHPPPTALLRSANSALAPTPKTPAATLPELIAFIRSKDGQLSYASSGAATPHHLFMAM